MLIFQQIYVIITSQVALVRSDEVRQKPDLLQGKSCENIGITQVALRRDSKGCFIAYVVYSLKIQKGGNAYAIYENTERRKNYHG